VPSLSLSQDASERASIGTGARLRPVLSALGLPDTSQQYSSLRTNQPTATSQQYSSLKTNQHQSSATSQPNRLFFSSPACFSDHKIDQEFKQKPSCSSCDVRIGI
jgi:hypothetical protein